MNLPDYAIVQVRFCHEYGGAERYVLDLTEQLLARGYRAKIITPIGSPLAAKAEQLPGAFITLPMRSGDFNLATLVRMSRVLRRHEFQLMNMHDGTVPCCLGSRLAGIPTVATVHGFRKKWPFLTADHLIAVSDAVGSHLIQQGISHRRITVVRNGTDSNFFTVGDRQSARQQLGLDNETFFFSVTSRLIPKKGVDLLLEAFAQIAPEYPACLLIAGTGAQAADLQALSARLGLTDKVRFLGFQADIRPLLAAADCHVLPSLIEPLGLSVLEAMACGRPCIATRSGGPAEVIADRVTGLLVDAGSVGQLAESLRFAVTNRAWVGEAGIAARASVEESYTLKAQVDGIEAVYLSLLR